MLGATGVAADRANGQLPARMRAASEALEIPTLLVRGGVSEVLSAEIAQEFGGLVPHAEIVDVSGAHHMVAGDDNDSFTAAVSGFLAGVR
jgi:non-heme chloroperoxidase